MRVVAARAGEEVVGSVAAASYWQWDYYVEGGYWVLWDGKIGGEWPE